MVVFLAPTASHAAGLILNELSNGPSGSKEFFELMVVGDAGSPTGNVNLNGWIVDDNNGDWQGSSTGIGISGGYVRFNTTSNPGSCSALNAVAPGSILVIYNPDDINANVPADDFSDANGDGIYVFAAGSACIESCRATPNNSSPAYSACTPKGTQNFSSLRLRNRGDVGQVRNPSANFFHGFAYGDITTPYPAGSFNIDGASGAGKTYIFMCGDWAIGSNFTHQSHTTETPGAANGTANAIFRQKTTNGTLNYSNLSAPANCDIDPDINVTKSSRTDSDPVNASTNPKAVPGAVIIYSIFIENTGFGQPDGSTVVIVDALPSETSLFVSNFVGGSPVAFIDGSVPSALSLTYGGLSDMTDSIAFSNDGGSSYTYSPIPDADGFDDNITHLRIVPNGTFAASDGTNDPSFTLEFKTRLD